mmetsp:Transcript_45366/g.105952  ORF Transcript_45366/g.105952 Transcript_45366/m.105952 type:complete len:246 (-) Transcript_45366:1166-1903(-)
MSAPPAVWCGRCGRRRLNWFRWRLRLFLPFLFSPLLPFSLRLRPLDRCSFFRETLLLVIVCYLKKLRHLFLDEVTGIKVSHQRLNMSLSNHQNPAESLLNLPCCRDVHSHQVCEGGRLQRSQTCREKPLDPLLRNELGGQARSTGEVRDSQAKTNDVLVQLATPEPAVLSVDPQLNSLGSQKFFSGSIPNSKFGPGCVEERQHKACYQQLGHPFSSSVFHEQRFLQQPAFLLLFEPSELMTLYPP